MRGGRARHAAVRFAVSVLRRCPARTRPRRVLRPAPVDLNDRILGLGGIADLQWQDEPDDGGWPLPLLAETELIVLIAFLAGLGIGRWSARPRREGYL